MMACDVSPVAMFSTADQLDGLDDGPQMCGSDMELWKDDMRKM